MPRKDIENLVTEAVVTHDPIPEPEHETVYDVRAVTLGMGDQVTIWLDKIPDYYHVLTIDRTPELKALLWSGTSLPAEALPLYGDGHTKFPGRSQYLTLRNVSGDSQEFRIIGLRNCFVEIIGNDLRDWVGAEPAS